MPHVPSTISPEPVPVPCMCSVEIPIRWVFPRPYLQFLLDRRLEPQVYDMIPCKDGSSELFRQICPASQPDPCKRCIGRGARTAVIAAVIVAVEAHGTAAWALERSMCFRFVLWDQCVVISL